MDEASGLLLILLVLVTVLVLSGIGLFIVLRWFFRLFSGQAPTTILPTTAAGPRPPDPLQQCFNCQRPFLSGAQFCPLCGAARLTPQRLEVTRDLAATLRQLERFHDAGAIDQVNFRVLKAKIESERELIIFPQGRTGVPLQASLFAPASRQAAPSGQSVTREAKPPPKAEPFTRPRPSDAPPVMPAAEVRPPTPPPKEPRKRFAEVLSAFMEQSNIRWGEIIGGVLIIGCSTALVISLWAQISRIPVLKFLIFTTVTAALFGVGFYTELRWKLPTTSRGILTIATLLVPLNFLAIAAVSGSTIPPGALVIGSELIAPALFLCLVYFAGRIITSAWPHLLAAGVLGSSAGQLLIRHLAAPENSPRLLVALGTLPVLCYVAATAWMLRRALADAEIDEGETNAIFVTLGAITFAAALPFGLLLYKSGPIGMTMMYLAPLVTLAGTPMLASGTLIWRKVTREELAAARTAGTSIAILGMVAVLAGMILAWPNPASIVPAALFNFAVFTALAIFLELPLAHVCAAGCLALAYTVTFHVIAGHVQWQNLRAASLLDVTASVSTGQALTVPFILFTLASEWLRRERREQDSFSYLIAACAVAAVSLLFVTFYGLRLPGDPHQVWAIFALYAAGMFWFAWRERSEVPAWAGCILVFFSSAQVCVSLLSLRFPWQAAMLLFASVCTAGAIIAWRYAGEHGRRIFLGPLHRSAVVGSILASLFLLTATISRGLEPARLLSTRMFLLAAIWLGLLIISRASIFFTSLQVTLVLGAVLSVKSSLQRFEWYAYQSNAWLHPQALQIQGTVLAFMCLAWIAIRMFARRQAEAQPANGPASEKDRESWTTAAWQFLNMPLAFDQLLAGVLLIGFAILAVFGAMTGVGQELTTFSSNPPSFNLAGFPHQLIFGAGSWILLATLLTVMLGNLWERGRGEFAIGALAALAIAGPLLAGRFEAQVATASAWRWFAAIFLLLGAIVFCLRERLVRALALKSSWTLGDDPRRSSGSLPAMLAVWLFLTLFPLLVLTIVPVIAEIRYLPPRGPQAGFFHWIGNVALYSVPLMMTAGALALYAIRERAPAFAFAAGLLVNLTVTVVHLLSIVAGHGLMNRVVLANSLQLNAIAAACVALFWMATRSWWMQPVSTTSERRLLNAQKLIAISLNSLLIVPVVIHLIAFPHRAGIGMNAVGSFTGWLALFLTVAVVIAFDKVFAKPGSVVALCAWLLAMGSLTAFGVARFGPANWLGFHVLLVAFALTAWLLLLARDLPKSMHSDSQSSLGPVLSQIGLTFADDWKWDSTMFASVVGAITVTLALRGPFSDPAGAWWSVGALVAMSALAASLNWVTLKRAYLYAAGILFNTSVSIWLIDYYSHRIHSGRHFLEANIIALSLSSVLWLWLELRARRVAAKTDQNTAWSFHNLAALLSLFLAGGIVAASLAADAFVSPLPPHLFLLDWLTLASVAILLIACLWDRDAKYSVAALYLAGLMFAGNALHELGLRPHRLGWAAMMVLAIYALVVSLIWRARRRVIELAMQFKIPPRIDPTTDELRWLTVFNSAAVVIVFWLAFWIDQRFLEWNLRATAALAVMAQALTFGFMSGGKWRRRWQRAAVAMFLLGVVFLGWSWLTPGATATWLNRAVILMTEMFAIVGFFGAGLDQLVAREPDWTRAGRDCVPAMTIAGIASLVFVLCTEVYYQIEFGAVRIKPLAQAVVGVTLAGSVFLCIFFALSPKHDPLSLSERRRSYYVYVAEAMLALLFMHIRLTMPWLFTGFFERYWPLVVMAIAYAGITVSEMFRRRQVRVLAEPIERTGALLPVLPVLGFWIAESKVDYSTLLFIVGGLYGLLSILRRSFLFGLLAALAGNGGLWHLLHHTSDYRFLQHPQLWLIPAALSVMIAAHLNREDFTEPQMTGIRYLALITIYVSSTSDIFVNGVAQSPWLPPILAALSIAGVFCGIMFRIRAFLVLGSIFLLLAITTMIYYASVNFGWTWLWYVAGIITGALIIATFAVFEKKRAEVLRVVDGLKDWQR
jgi:hypothetical protein